MLSNAHNFDVAQISIGPQGRRLNGQAKKSIESDFVDYCKSTNRWFAEFGTTNRAIQGRGQKLDETQSILDSLMVSEINLGHTTAWPLFSDQLI